ncbi:hypothetical protein FUAX_42220 (plasmid) [Fulvitalea axinellae]|uniref:Lipoprotein n=1 Tax=Fulvitalea axinellae TaxID=1182444 RepID=A0AAU9DGV1_9BACT|nr:hypothetical protein FUAX_42220 [Fulvitalea axinellae]
MIRLKISGLLLIALILSLYLASCSSDNDDEGTTKNSVTLNDASYTLSDGLFIDYGAGQTHYNKDFYVIDGQFVQQTTNGSNGYDVENAKLMIVAEMYSLGTEKFVPGTFEYIDGQTATPDDVKDISFFYPALAVIDSNDDGKFTQTDTSFPIKGGKVTVSGTSPNYEVSYEVTLDNGKTMKGSFSGAFKSIDATGTGTAARSHSDKNVFSVFR